MSVYFKLSLARVQNEVDSLSLVYLDRAGEAVRYIRAKRSLSEIGKVMSARIAYEKILGGAYKMLPVGVFVVDASFDEANLVSFSGRANGVALYNEFLARIEEQKDLQGFLFEKIVQSKLTRSKAGDYNFELKLTVADAN